MCIRDRPDDTTAATINRPSDGSERAVANHLFLVATNEPTGELGHFYVQADNAYVLAGSKMCIRDSPCCRRATASHPWTGTPNG